MAKVPRCPLCDSEKTTPLGWYERSGPLSKSAHQRSLLVYVIKDISDIEGCDAGCTVIPLKAKMNRDGADCV
jgi:hypothetical protein